MAVAIFNIITAFVLANAGVHALKSGNSNNDNNGSYAAVTATLNESAVGWSSQNASGSDVPVDGSDVLVDGSDVCVEGSDISVDGSDVPVDGSNVPVDGSDVSVDGSDVLDDGSDVLVERQKDDAMAKMVSTAQSMHWASSVVVGPFFVVVGIVGNVLSIIVWSRPHMRSSTGRYLTALAVADTGVLAWFVVTDTLQVVYPPAARSATYALFFAYLGFPVFFICVFNSTWYMVGVTVDRCLMVCLLTKAKAHCNVTRANLGLVLITIASVLINMPRFWFYKVDWAAAAAASAGQAGGEGGEQYDNIIFSSSNSSRNSSSSSSNYPPALVKTPFGMGPHGARYEFWVHCMFLVLAPWITVFTLNMIIIWKISSSNRTMNGTKTAESADKSRRAENKITGLLLMVTFSYLLLTAFLCISQCFFMILPIGYDPVIIDEVFAMAKLGAVINSSLNFIFYCVSGRRFRREVMRAVGWRGPSSLLSSSGDQPHTGATYATDKSSP